MFASPGLASCRWRPLSSNVRPAWPQCPSPPTRLAEASRLENLPARFGASLLRHRQCAKARLRARLGSRTLAPTLALLRCRAAAQQRRLEVWSACWLAALPRAPGASQTLRLRSCFPGGARCAALARAGLTRHSTGPSTAGQLGPASAASLSCASRAKLPCRSGPVSSNVRPHTTPFLRAMRDNTQRPRPVAIETWRLWLGRLLLVPLVALSGGFAYVLFMVAARGEINTLSKGWAPVPSRTVQFAESPLLFSFYFLLLATLTGLIIFVTFVVARMVIRKTRTF
jgi:hypothetical protein